MAHARRPLESPTWTAAAVALAGLTLVACAEPPASGADAWLVAPADFKNAAVPTNCRLDGQGEADGTEPRPGIERLYACVRAAMATAYAEAGVTATAGYQEWARFSTRPYLSATHARRQVNNYANALAAPAYGAYGEGGPLPVGAVVAKDSFSVAADGRVAFGPLFVMEKVAAESWRYTMVMPEGWVLGTTAGPGTDTVAFCAECHAAAPRGHDQLFFLPPQYRR